MAKKRQSSVGSSLRAWSPDPTQLSSLKKSGAQPAGSQAPQATQSGRLGPADCEPAAETRMGERFTATQRPGLRLVGDLGEGSDARQDTAPNLFSGAPSSPAGPRLGDLKGLGGKARIPLLPHSPPHGHHSTVV